MGLVIGPTRPVEDCADGIRAERGDRRGVRVTWAGSGTLGMDKCSPHWSFSRGRPCQLPGMVGALWCDLPLHVSYIPLPGRI